MCDSMKKKTLIIVICILVIVLSIGMITLRRSLPSQSYLNINEPSEQFYNYTNEIDNILNASGFLDEPWLDETENSGIELRKEVLLPSGEALTILLSQNLPYTPSFYLYFSGEKLNNPSDCQLVCDEYPWIWEIINLLGGGNLSKDRFENICVSQRKEIIDTISQNRDDVWVNTYSKEKSIRKGIISIGHIQTSVEAEYTSEDQFTAYYSTQLFVNMYLYW